MRSYDYFWRMKGTLYLVPNSLGNPDLALQIPPGITPILSSIRVFIVEDLRNARRYLKLHDRSIDIDSLHFHLLNEHTDDKEVPGFLKALEDGQDAALLSDAGVPGVADPGALVVRLAHEKGIRVIPLTGPSSILLSLMASGMNGQQFSFHGYLPVKGPERMRRIRELEQRALQEGSTQIFIEAPYRNDALLRDLVSTCKPGTRLCVAADISLESEYIRTFRIAEWKKQKPALHKRPAIFLLGV